MTAYTRRTHARAALWRGDEEDEGGGVFPNGVSASTLATDRYIEEQRAVGAAALPHDERPRSNGKAEPTTFETLTNRPDRGEEMGFIIPIITIAIVYNNTQERIRVQTLRNPQRQGNRIEVSPGDTWNAESGSELLVPRCVTAEEFKEDHIEVYAAQEGNGQAASDWRLCYQLWHDGAKASFSTAKASFPTGGTGFPPEATVLEESEAGRAHKLTISDLEGQIQMEVSKEV
jgi:hypothetical protein